MISAIETLCRNEAIAQHLLAEGFPAALLRVASDKSLGEGLIALSMQRSAVQALTTLSQIAEAKVILKKQVRAPCPGKFAVADLPSRTCRRGLAVADLPWRASSGERACSIAGNSD